MTSLVAVVCALAAVVVGCVVVATPAVAASRPTVSGLSRHRGPYWGASLVVVWGTNLGDAQKVMFGADTGYALHVLSPTKLVVIDPEHDYGTVHVRVVTSTGVSLRSPRDRFTYTRPTMHTPIMGGLTARQEQRISARVRAAHHGVRIAPWRKRWTPAMGATAARRARSWLGLPYSWAGGNGSGPTLGVCAHNGGDLDCHVVGFDCSGLTLYAWSPYKELIHYAASQHSQAGRFHPTKGELVPGDLVFFSGYIADGIGHVAVYVGHGMVIQAAQSGTQVMRSRLVDTIAESGVYRGATRPMSIGRQGPGPRISALGSRMIPAAGGYVRITGRHLATTTSVSIGGKTVYSFAKRSARYLKVRVPAHRPGPVRMSVSNAWGTVHRKLSYVGAPTISALSPPSGPTAGRTQVTIAGTGLAAVGRVELGGQPVEFHQVAPDRLTFTTPPHAAGAVPVTVTSRFGTSNAVPYTFGAPSTDAVRHSHNRSEPKAARVAGPARRSTPHAAAPPVAFGTGAASSGDRIGIYWYLVGRLSVQRYSGDVHDCAETGSQRFTDCLARAVLFPASR
jgi:cell wall-associated NlpC family hydrolase